MQTTAIRVAQTHGDGTYSVAIDGMTDWRSTGEDGIITVQMSLAGPIECRANLTDLDLIYSLWAQCRYHNRPRWNS